MSVRVCWSDGDLVHVAYLGWWRAQAWCEVVPVTHKPRDRAVEIASRVEGPATCLACAVNEGARPWTR